MSLVRTAFRRSNSFKQFSVATIHKAAMSSESIELVSRKHIGFLGSGNMARALAKGFLRSGMIKGNQVTMTDIFGTSPEHEHLFAPIRELQQTFGIEYMQTNDVMVQKSDIIFACIKPHLMRPVLKDLSAGLNNKLLISVAAGITIDQLSQVVPESTRLVRVMPNTPCLVGAGTGIFSGGPNTSADDIKLTKMLCSSVFKVFEEIPESLMDAATGISGCGPAYMFLIIEALTDGGVRMGVPRHLAHKLAVSTMAGSAAMMEETKEEPSKLRGDVCSPGGATIAGVHALESGGLRATLMNAVQAAVQRSKELSQ